MCRHGKFITSCIAFSRTTHAGTEYLPLAKVKEATKEVCSDWYSLAVELGVSYGVRKVGVVTGDL